MLQGKKTYIVAAMILLCVAVEKGLGIDVPGVEIADNWLMLVFESLGLASLRNGVASGLLNRMR